MTAAIGSVRDRVLEFLANYGERGYAVLRAAVEAVLSRESTSRGIRLGDFSFREVQSRLRAWGIEYNPSMLLRILERDYGVIETSYRSGNQHWWRFIDLNAVIEALQAFEEGADPLEEDGEDIDVELEVIRAQIAALGLDEVIETLKRLLLKPRLTKSDRRVFEQIAFTKLEQIARLLEKAEDYADQLATEIQLMKEAIRLASRISRKLLGLQVSTRRSKSTIEALAGAKETVLPEPK